MGEWTREDVDRRNREIFGEDAWRPGCKPGETARPAEPASAPMRESLIEKECTKLLEEDGWRALRTDPVSDRGRGKGFGEIGMADHLYIRYRAPIGVFNGGMPRPKGHEGGVLANSTVLWIEFKSAKGKPSKAQLDWHAKERARGALTLIAGVDFPASVAGFQAYYAASGLERRV